MNNITGVTGLNCKVLKKYLVLKKLQLIDGQTDKVHSVHRKIADV